MIVEGIYDLNIFHRRKRPFDHEFNIRSYCFLLNLDKCTRGNTGLKFLRYDRMGMHSFRRADFSLLNNLKLSPRDCVLTYAKLEHPEIQADTVYLLANMRVLGYTFNPVSFFFLSSGSNHVATVVEVNNTFGEQKHYVLPGATVTTTQPKNFYVSPFISPFAGFEFMIRTPGKNLEIEINSTVETGLELHAAMRGKLYNLSDWQLIRFFFRYPFNTLRVIILIHWFAIKLVIKGVAYYPKKNADAAIIQRNLRGQL